MKPENELFEPYLRHAQWFLSRLQNLNQSYRAYAHQVDSVISLFDNCHAQIRAAFNWTANNLADSEAAAELCVQFAVCSDSSGGNSLLDLRQTPTENRHWIERGLQAARRLGLREAEAVLLYHLAGIEFGERRLDDAIVHAEAAFGSFRDAGDIRQAAIVLNLLAILSLARGEDAEAAAHAEESLAAFRALDSAGDIAFTLSILGQINLRMKRFHDVVRVAHEGLSRARDSRDSRTAVSSLRQLAIAFIGLGEPHKALAFEAEAIQLLCEGDSSAAVWATGSGMFDLIRALGGDTVGGIQKLEQDLIDFRKVGNWLGEGFALAGIGLSEIRGRNRQSGLAHLNQSLELFMSRNYMMGVDSVRACLAKVAEDGETSVET